MLELRHIDRSLDQMMNLDEAAGNRRDQRPAGQQRRQPRPQGARRCAPEAAFDFHRVPARRWSALEPGFIDMYDQAFTE